MSGLSKTTRAFHGFRAAVLTATALLAASAATAAATPDTDLPVVRAGTAALLAARADWAAATTADDRTAAAQRMLRVAATRMQALARIADGEPQLLASAMLPAHEIARLPAFVRPYLEEQRTVQGTLEVRWADYGDHARRMDVLRSDDGRWQLRYTTDPRNSRLTTGTSIEATGVAVGDLLALDPGAAEATAGSSGIVFVPSFGCVKKLA